jgi:1-acyl-sn-glycerol-3-phosphate acyltransferase
MTIPAVPLAQGILQLFQTQVQVRYETPLPKREGFLLVVSNHRSFLDAPILISALARPLSLICHYYLGQVPLLNEVVRQLGGMPLGPGGKGWPRLFTQTKAQLQAGEVVAIFPEGGQIMTQFSLPNQGSGFKRGFVHLALRSGIENLALVPVAIVSKEEVQGPFFPVQLLRLFDNQEPLFQAEGWHPYVVYQRVRLMVGEPQRLTAQDYAQYRAGQVVAVTQRISLELTQRTRQLTRQGLVEPW